MPNRDSRIETSAKADPTGGAGGFPQSKTELNSLPAHPAAAPSRYPASPAAQAYTKPYTPQSYIRAPSPAATGKSAQPPIEQLTAARANTDSPNADTESC